MGPELQEKADYWRLVFERVQPICPECGRYLARPDGEPWPHGRMVLAQCGPDTVCRARVYARFYRRQVR